MVGVIFDMDGVLVDSAEAHWQSWRLLLEENGRSASKETFAQTFGKQNRDIIPILFGPVVPGRLIELSDRKEVIYRDIIRDQVPIVDGAVRLINELAEADTKLAIGSSGPLANIQLVLNAMNVAHLFSAIVSADDVTRGKPDPQVFSLACQRLALPPHRCVVIEDAPVGITAARAAGTKSVAVLMHHSVEAFREADVTASRLGALTATTLKNLAEADIRTLYR